MKDIPFGALVAVVVTRDVSGGDSNAPKNKNKSKRTNSANADKGGSTHQHFTFSGVEIVRSFVIVRSLVIVRFLVWHDGCHSLVFSTASRAND